uniref:Saposin B-type domain-containing protein n=1 Tax=Parascaris univalens TaxID=6257 RepID=A0A915AP54_PARUN
MLLKVFVLLSVLSLVASQISCVFCQVGLSDIVSRIQDTPGTLERIGWQMSSKCDSIPNKQNRIGCRQMLREHFRELFNGLVTNPATEPQQLCTALGFC